MVQESEGKLDAHGQLNVEFQIPEADENDPWDYSYRLDAQVTDASRRTLNGAASFVATRGNTVAHASPERYVYTKGDVAKIRVKTTDYEGASRRRQDPAAFHSTYLDQGRKEIRERLLVFGLRNART